MEIFFWVVAAMLAAFGLFMNYSNWKMYFESRKAKEAFLKNNKDAKMVYIKRSRPWLFSLLAAACLAFGILLMVVDNPMSDASRYSQVCVYLSLAIFAVGMMAEALTDCQVVYSNDGFMMENTYIRFKSIRSVQVGKGFFKGSMLILNGMKEMPVNKSMAVWTEEHLKEWSKNRRENRRAHRKNKGAARED